MIDSETGEEPERAVECSHQRYRDEAAKPAFRDGKVRDDPPCAGSDACVQAASKGSYFVGCEAIEKEVGDDEVVGRLVRIPLAGVCEVNANTPCMNTGVAGQCQQHSTA